MRKILDWFKRKLELVTVDPFDLEPKDFGMAKIEARGDKFILLNKGNQIVGTYSRERDARRGAQRRGLTFA